MSRKIHFEDNLYYLAVIMKNMSEAFLLEIDSEFFLEKTIEDIFHIDSTLVRLYTLLIDNPGMVHRNQYLRDILRTKKIFADLLTDILDKKSPFAQYLEPFFLKLKSCREDHLNDLNAIHLQLQTYIEDRADDTDMISAEELRILLMNDHEIETR